jgi:hypothetical protein
LKDLSSEFPKYQYNIQIRTYWRGSCKWEYSALNCRNNSLRKDLDT